MEVYEPRAINKPLPHSGPQATRVTPPEILFRLKSSIFVILEQKHSENCPLIGIISVWEGPKVEQCSHFFDLWQSIKKIHGATLGLKMKIFQKYFGFVILSPEGPPGANLSKIGDIDGPHVSEIVWFSRGMALNAMANENPDSTRLT